MTEPTTLLSIDGIDFSDYAVRGITCTLRPDTAGSLSRDWNGQLVDLTIEQFRKHLVSISCNDIEGPPFADVWKGSGPYTVRLIEHLIGETGSTDNILTLSMLVEDWNVSRDEWGAETGWQLDLREV